jgi:hypothetical protein
MNYYSTKCSTAYTTILKVHGISTNYLRIIMQIVLPHSTMTNRLTSIICTHWINISNRINNTKKRLPIETLDVNHHSHGIDSDDYMCYFFL